MSNVTTAPPNFTARIFFFRFFVMITSTRKKNPNEVNVMLYVNNLHKSYQTGSKTYPVLKGVSFQVAKGEFVAMMGPSGYGKSTLLNCISCYIPFEKGNIKLGGQTLANLNDDELSKIRNEKLGFVFQDFMLLDGLTIRENILVPRIIHGTVGKEGEQLADRLLELFGIDRIRNKYPADVSGGERQRTAVGAKPNQPAADDPCRRTDRKPGQQIKPHRDRSI